MTITALALLASGLALGGGAAFAATTSSGTLYTPNSSANPSEDASYPRVIRLAHSGSSNGTMIATFAHSGAGTTKANFPLYRSTNNGVSWTASPIGTVTDTLHGWDLDGPTLYELPSAKGDLPAGTLLAAGTAWNHGDYTQQSVEVFISKDQGVTWTYRSSCTSETGTPNTIMHGIWEPEFNVASNGNLVCYFSDERPSSNNYNQVLAHVSSTDGGATWGSEVYDVAIQDGVQRPGMATVVNLPNGSYAMSYEDCKNGFDPDQACDVYIKTSTDGVTWNPGSLGTRIQTSDSRFLLHTPYLTWSPAGGANGTLIVSGQRVVAGNDGALTVLPESGHVLLINKNLGIGTWKEITTAVTVAPTGGYDAGETACAGYSSPLLAATTGSSFIMLAGTHIASGKCETRFATANLPSATGPITGPGSVAKCLDVNNNTSAQGNAVQLYDCGVATGQQWSLESDGTIRAFDKCLDITGNGTANFAKVELWGCNNGVGGQQWVARADGSLYNPQSGRCLDDPGAATTNGTQLQIYDCNGLSTQAWHVPTT
ncbi:MULTISPECIES: ricin-type beta-trefoil lectin domain protein [unclassified Cryobacterium]|uniref:ricin-type beta-trefoil lectin domain protein n=1 Tax=unclassified Cryobacterium TaxID=2649013 RepID=UPI002AB3CC5D|nr:MULTISPECIES: ricin-type beta-trefoil lectin domain protein [Cryobacterium]MDY7526363.1 ricin-type beta-trefoil lectin domain protein [Cryobacterium sp. 10C2]MDY7557833.1 ricin-type beta-trefoil lectin domain protein [Cryobacterium sp. 10C3]MEB0003775.1 ricin-type beta-trefoil lectin domain protein [Cryobacterium sp. RTC2.1]MEB0203345.1 ricin-type beta-trefoil lectin domain protein [Cryobacterium sp. 5I3]MEB0287882.1 ricin-type beta-trefoil lectin domain protein [Cryobacterium sp. 10S3]